MCVWFLSSSTDWLVGLDGLLEILKRLLAELDQAHPRVRDIEDQNDYWRHATSQLSILTVLFGWGRQYDCRTDRVSNQVRRVNFAGGTARLTFVNEGIESSLGGHD